jgi:hypothetical protein
VTAVTKPNYSLREIRGGVWALGSVSMLTDVSSEMIHASLPIYLVTVLATSMVMVSVIEGCLHLVLEELHPEIVGSVLILGLVRVLVEVS